MVPGLQNTLKSQDEVVRVRDTIVQVSVQNILIQLETFEETWRTLEKFGRISENPDINHYLDSQNPQES